MLELLTFFTNRMIPILFWNIIECCSCLVAGVPQEDQCGHNILLYMDILEMYSGICCVLSKCILLDEACRSTVLHTHNYVHSLVALFDPAIYCEYLNNHGHWIKGHISVCFHFYMLILYTCSNQNNWFNLHIKL